MNGTIKYLIFILFLLSCEKDAGRYTTNWYFVNQSGERITLKLYAGNLLKGDFKIKSGKDCYFASSTHESAGYDISTPPGINKFVLELSNGTVLSDSCNYLKDSFGTWNAINNCDQKPKSLFNRNSYEKRERKLLFSGDRIYDRYFIFTGK